jgi:LPXTG-motif cell wall-anchored protein
MGNRISAAGNSDYINLSTRLNEERSINMKKILIAGALLLTTVGGTVMASSSSAVMAQGDNEGVCAGLDSGKIDTSSDPLTVTITAPDGNKITGYCVKAGSINQGDGPEYVELDPPQSSVTFGHSSGKAVSHYSYSYEPFSDPTTTTTMPEVTTTDAKVTTTTTGSNVTTTVATTGAPTTTVGNELPATGSAERTGMALMALGLLMGGIGIVLITRRPEEEPLI